MESGQKQVIALDSGLDVKSSDMLVPVSQPKFQHNRQKFQGRYLPTSLRYEHDGWAAGWDVYQFKFENVEVPSSPEGMLVIKQKLNNNPAYVLVFQEDTGDGKRKEYARLWWNYESSCTDSTVDVSHDGRITEYQGTVNGKSYKVTVDPVAGNVSVSDGFDLKSVMGSDGRYMFTVVDTSSEETISVDRLHDALPVTCNNKYTVAEYVSLADGTHTWRGDNAGVTFDGTEVLLDGEPPTSVAVSGPSLSFVLDSMFQIKGSIKYGVDEWYPSILKTNVSYDNGRNLVAMDSQVGSDNTNYQVDESTPFNRWTATMTKGYMSSGNRSIITGYIPLWAGITFGFTNPNEVEVIDSQQLDITNVGQKSQQVTIPWELHKDTSGTRAVVICDWVPVHLEPVNGTPFHEDDIYLGNGSVPSGYEKWPYEAAPQVGFKSVTQFRWVPDDPSLTEDDLVSDIRNTLGGNYDGGIQKIDGTMLGYARGIAHDGRTFNVQEYEITNIHNTSWLHNNTAEIDWRLNGSSHVYGLHALFPVNFRHVDTTYDARLFAHSDEDNEYVFSEEPQTGITIGVWEAGQRLDDSQVWQSGTEANIWVYSSINAIQCIMPSVPAGTAMPPDITPMTQAVNPADGTPLVDGNGNPIMVPVTGLSELDIPVSDRLNDRYFELPGLVSPRMDPRRFTWPWPNAYIDFTGKHFFEVRLAKDGITYMKKPELSVNVASGLYMTVQNADGDESEPEDEEGTCKVLSGFFEGTQVGFNVQYPRGHWSKGKWPWSSKKWQWDRPGKIDLQDIGRKFKCPDSDVLYYSRNYLRKNRYTKDDAKKLFDGEDIPYEEDYLGNYQYVKEKNSFEKSCISVAYKGWWQCKVEMSDRLTDSNVNTKISIGITDGTETDDGINANRYWVDRPVSVATPKAYHLIDVTKQSLDITSEVFTLKLVLLPVSQMVVSYCFQSGKDYVPGYILNDSIDQAGDKTQFMGSKTISTALADTNNMFRFQLNGTAYLIKTIKDASVSVSSKQKYKHEFYNTVLPGLSSISYAGTEQKQYVIDDYDGAFTYSEDIKLVNDYYTLVIRHSISLGNKKYDDTLALVSAQPFNADGYTVNVGTGHSVDGTISSEFTFGVPLRYEFKTMLPYVDGGEYTILSYMNKRYVMKKSTGDFRVDTELLKVTAADGDTFDVTSYGDGSYSFGFTSKVGTTFMAVARGPFKASGCEVKDMNNERLTILINGKEYTFNISDVGLFDMSAIDRLMFLCTDVRDPDMRQKHIQTVNTGEEFQFLKQQWDTTVETENFWWIDDSHVLALTKDKLVLREKTEELSDWDGDVFRDAAQWPRSDYVGGSVLRYGMTSAKGGDTAMFWTTVLSSGSSVTLRFYDPLDNMLSWAVEVGLVVHKLAVMEDTNLGKKLSGLLNEKNNVLNTYSELQMLNVLATAKMSSTCVDGYVLFGIHFDNNFNQWALKIDRLSHNFTVVQGYGFVGVDGCLTGGEIPLDYFDPERGFSSGVQSIEAVKCELREAESVADFMAIDIEGSVVGSDSQQWYIKKELKDIVSHLTWNGKGWDVQTLPLNNNVAQVYKSPSAVQRTCTDLAPTVSNGFSGLLPVESDIFKVLDVLLTVCGMPSFYSIYPKINSIVYLQQTMGQYAYVHYNSTNAKQPSDTTKQDDTKNTIDPGETGDEVKAIRDDELAFNIHTIKQEGVACSDPNSSDLLTMLMTALTSASDYGNNAMTEKVNEKQNQTATSDVGKKFSQYFLQNLDSMSSSALAVRGSMPTQTSTVTGLLSLDMFYSTSDMQEVSAGPGWVNHNFVAQCVAQSITTTHLELSQTGAYCLFSILTMAELKLQMYVSELAINAIYKIADITSRLTGPAAMGSGVGTLPGSIAAAALTAGAKVLEARYAAQKALAEVMPDLLKMMGADRVNTSITAQKSAHATDAEGKHKYGSKSEHFMWPCFGCAGISTVHDESVEAGASNKPWTLKVAQYAKDAFGKHSDDFEMGGPKLSPLWTRTDDNDTVAKKWNGEMDYFIANCKGKITDRTLPADTAYVIGTDTFMPEVLFRNENIGESDPVFTTPPFQDYIIDKDWQLGHTASVGMTTWVSCKDTKILDGEPSNVVVSDDFCGVASPYAAVEIKRGITRKYMRPWAITPQALALNNTGFNCCYEEKAYHAFDGYGYRIVNWVGSSGMNKERQVWQYSFIVNDRFKRSNKMPLNEFAGFFKSDPVLDISALGDDKVFALVTIPGENKGLTAGTVGEDKDVRRYAVPVFSEFVSTLPAAVKTISSIGLSVIDGITSLTTENRDLQVAYKAPVSVDFAIGKNLYRYTSEYICSLQQTSGVTMVQELVPCLGLTYLGSTPYEAYLYSQATRQYYKYTGGSSLQMVDMIERFRNVICGRYDFVNQEVIVPCLATFLRLDKKVHDDTDETDNIITPRLKDGDFKGEVSPPVTTIFNTRSWYRTLSLPCGVTYQGPNRCIINRFVYSDYMREQIKENYGKWKRVPREEYHPFRKYKSEYAQVDEDIGDIVLVEGWTHNQFLLVTAPLGIASEKDCLFEWEITFCWPVEMDELYGPDDYAVVNITAETMTPGGKVIAERPTHVYLHKELFTRTGNYGYYSFRYQSRCGAGNRERLHIWSDQYIAVSSLQVEYKQVTEKRTEVLTQQIDMQRLHEI